ncbi:hypothetical protein M569_12464, partial [Genlisea aurea]
MHGRPRRAPTDEEELSSSRKAAEIRLLQLQLLDFHHNKIYTTEAMEISAKLLESNPEHYTGWNFRKLAVQSLLDQHSGSGDHSEAIRSILGEELKLVENALRTNVKSYSAWYHRRWILSKGYSSMDRELHLLDKFCKLDPRNFHMWNYRRFITALKNIPDDEEFNYTTHVIEDNFSNYSAWHNRSVLLLKLMEKNIKGHASEEGLLKDEYDFVRNALFTDPDDQSGWFYHLWLLGRTLKREPSLLSSWPPQGSDLHLGHDATARVRESDLEVVHFRFRTTRAIPLVLYFTEAVNGVSSSTVSVKCKYHAFDDLSFRSLSADASGFSPAWMADLKFPDKAIEPFSVEIAIAELPGIASSTGMPFGEPRHVSFSVTVSSRDDRVLYAEEADEKISWRDENFFAAEKISTSDLRNKKRPTEDHIKRKMEIISGEIDHCRELLLSTDCKIGKLTLARLLASQSILDDGAEVKYEEILRLYHDLKKMDPAHISYYEDQYSLVLLQQVVSDPGSLGRHCSRYLESPSSSSNPYSSSLRLNGMSLSRIGSVENFLWVQMLDLSRNKLHAVEGLEALQLLSRLNLSRNKFGSFAALEPLKLLSSLSVLDLSHNGIGSRPVDTRRYLSPSPLNHAVEMERTSDEAAAAVHWDAYLLFKDMSLVQLDVAGNRTAEE